MSCSLVGYQVKFSCQVQEVHGFGTIESGLVVGVAESLVWHVEKSFGSAG